MREKKDQLGLRFKRINHCSENNHLAINDTCTDSRPVQREAGVTQLLQWVGGGAVSEVPLIWSRDVRRRDDPGHRCPSQPLTSLNAF